MHLPVCHGYGMTECPMIAQGGPHDTPDQLAHTEGKPVVGLEVRIVKADGSVGAASEEGEVRVRGSIVCKGYTDAELTKAAFDDDGWFKTGDLGVVRPDGHIALTGRLKDVIIRKGENISAKEVEDLLFTHPKVADAAVIGLPDARSGERAAAIVVAADPSDPPTLAELFEFCRAEGLMVQKIPEQLEFVDVLPRNPAGKVLKRDLQAAYKDSKPTRRT
jgi:acyl-CoA synthetase (AMP-forming)/AMP-acid ligase II